VARLWHPLRYEQIVLGHSANYDLDPALLAAVIYQERPLSRRRPLVFGRDRLMQLMPATAQGIADHTGGTRYKPSDLYDPEINVRYGAWYLRHLMNKYKSEKLALAAYNAGQENVDRWLASGEGIAFPETRAYVKHVEQLKSSSRRIYPGSAQEPEVGLGGRATSGLRLPGATSRAPRHASSGRVRCS